MQYIKTEYKFRHFRPGFTFITVSLTLKGLHTRFLCALWLPLACALRWSDRSQLSIQPSHRTVRLWEEEQSRFLSFSFSASSLSLQPRRQNFGLFGASDLRFTTFHPGVNKRNLRFGRERSGGLEMNPPCARCGKIVYPTEKVSCLDKVGTFLWGQIRR